MFCLSDVTKSNQEYHTQQNWIQKLKNVIYMTKIYTKTYIFLHRQICLSTEIIITKFIKMLSHSQFYAFCWN